MVRYCKGLCAQLVSGKRLSYKDNVKCKTCSERGFEVWYPISDNTQCPCCSALCTIKNRKKVYI